MQSGAGLIARLNRAEDADRLLDAQVIARVLGPPGAVIDPVQDLDGWSIDYPVGDDGAARQWMCSSDVLPITGYVDSALEFLAEARPHDGAEIVRQALARVIAHWTGSERIVSVGSRIARAMAMEVLLAMAREDADRAA